MLNTAASFFQRPVIAALSFQGVSVFVGVASVPLLVYFLSNEDFLAWVLIATFGALTLQIEQGIQIVATRRLAHHWHSADQRGFLKDLTDVRRKFRRLSVAVLLGLGSFGVIYFGILTDLHLSSTWPLAWGTFILAYGINYWFGFNNVILLATRCTFYFNLTNAFTRSLNFFLTLFLLSQGLSIFGLALSFLISVILSVTLMRRRAIRQISTFPPDASSESVSVGDTAKSFRHTTVYTLYSLSNFALYRGAFLLFPLLHGKDNISNYGLALQLVAIVYAISIIPTQVWLDWLMRAVLDRDLPRIRHNLIASLTFALLVFVVFFLVLLVLARPALDIIGSNVALPSNSMISLIFIAFLVEAFIFVIVNLLLVLNVPRFLWRYIGGVWTALAFSWIISVIWPDASIATVFLCTSLALQALTTLPLALWYAIQETKKHS